MVGAAGHGIEGDVVAAGCVEPALLVGHERLLRVPRRAADVDVSGRVERDQSRVLAAPRAFDRPAEARAPDIAVVGEDQGETGQDDLVHGTQLRVTSSSSTTSGALRPAASAAKLITSRCVSTVGATARRSSSSGMGRPSSAARALAPRIKYWDARGPAPHDTYCLMNGGASSSGGRVIRTSVTAARTSGFGTGMRRTRCCNANTSSAVNTGAISVAASPVVASTIVSSSSLVG